ncbi:MAG: AsmA-like C-terminal region-containing protein [Roseovarius sp.]
MDQHTPSAPNRHRRGRKLRKAGLWSFAALFFLTGVVVIGALSLIGTRVSAPDWLRERITTQVNQGVAGIDLDFTEMSVVLERDWVPRLSLQGVTVRDAEGTPIARLSDVRSAVALGPLLKGELRPGAIHLSGARMVLRRSADGAVGLSIGETANPLEEAPNVAALIEQADAVLARPHFAALSEITADNLTLRFEDARAGRAWTVDGGRLELRRKGEALTLTSDLALLGARDYATTLALAYTSNIGDVAARLSVEFQDMPAGDIAGQSPALAWLGALDAPLSGAISAEVDSEGALGPLDVALDIGTGVLRPVEGAAPVPFSRAAMAFTYEPEAQVIRISDAEIESPWVSARATGHTYLTGMEDGWPDTLLSQLRFEKIVTNPMAIYPEPLEIEGAALDMRLALDPFRVTIGELSLTDQGRPLRARGEVLAGPEGWDVSVDAEVPSIAPERLLALWPEALEPKARDWITENVVTADLSNIQFALRLAQQGPPNVFLGFDFDALETRFIKDVPHIENGSGHASILDNRFVITAQGGHVTPPQGGRIDITGSSFEIPDLRIHRGPGRVLLRTESSITAALSLLDSGPFRFLQKAGRPVTLADGRGRLEGQLDFLVKDDLTPDEVAFSVKGELEEVRSETLVKGRVVAASSLQLTADNAALTVGGQGRLGKVPFDGLFTMPLTEGSNGRANVEGRIELSERFADEFQIGLPPGSLSGAGWGSLEVDFAPDTPPEFRLTSDLEGVGLALRQLDWALSPAATGRLEVMGALSEPPRIDRVRINAGGLVAEGAIALTEEGQLRDATFSRVQLGTWMDAPVQLVGMGPGRAPLVRVLGGEIDLRQTSLASSGEGPRGERGSVSLQLDRLQISDGLALTAFDAELDMSEGARGTFSGRVNGGARITGQVVPQSGGSAFTIRSEDAGGVFRSADILPQARDGDLTLFLAPGQERGTYMGKLISNGIRVKDAPAMAALLNAVSVVGLLDQLSGDGIHFSRVEAKFKLEPERVTLYSGSATGASMGISMEGYYHLKTGYMDMEGVVSPVYAVNMLGGVFARQGEGLVGFTYDLKGEKGNPRVQVNPLSVLTPGMFREIFRRTPPQYDGVASDGAREGTAGEAESGVGATTGADR